MKRFVSFCLSICIVVSLMPLALAEERTFVINGRIITKWTGWVEDSNCSGYAGNLIANIYPNKRQKRPSGIQLQFTSSDNMLRNKSAEERKITAEHVKEFIQNVRPGARIRVCKSDNTWSNDADDNAYGHTMILAAKNDAAGTFTTLESVWINRKYQPQVYDYTYESFTEKFTNYAGAPTYAGYNAEYFYYIYDLQGIYGDEDSNTPPIPSGPTTISFNLVTPSKVPLGKPYNLEGQIRATGSSITSITAEVYDADSGSKKLSKKVAISQRAYNIKYSGLDQGINMQDLPAGNYYVKYTVTAGDKKESAKTGAFQVGDKPEASTLKFLDDMKTPGKTLPQGSYFELGGTISSNYNITFVEGSIRKADTGDTVDSYEQSGINKKSFSLAGSRVDNNLEINLLPPGKYEVTYAVGDDSGKRAFWKSPKFQIASAVEKCTSHTRGAAEYSEVDHPHRNYYECTACGESFADGSTNYVESCELCNPTKEYTIYFDARGGKASQTSKKVKEGDVPGKLPTATREGYEFGGWHTLEDETHIGMIVLPDNCYIMEDTTLYAIWKKLPDDAMSTPTPKPEAAPEPEPTWGPWSSWSDTPIKASDTRQVETQTVEDAPARTEYRYGYYTVGSTSIWCVPYGKTVASGKVGEYITPWSTTRIPKVDRKVYCSDKSHNHQHVASTEVNGWDTWYLYREDGKWTGWDEKDYYFWEESREVKATYKTQYRYRERMN